MKRWISSVSLPVDLGEIADKYIFDFSAYVQDCIRRDFSIQGLTKLNELDLKKIEERKKIIAEFEKDKSVKKEQKKEFSNEDLKSLTDKIKLRRTTDKKTTYYDSPEEEAKRRLNKTKEEVFRSI